MPELLSIRDAALRLGCRPRDLSDRFYDGRIPNECCLKVSGRRVVPAEALDRIAKVLRDTRCITRS